MILTDRVFFEQTLVRQWKHELFKHVSDGALKVLALFTAKDKFPPTPEELSTFDVVSCFRAPCAFSITHTVPTLHSLGTSQCRSILGCSE